MRIAFVGIEKDWEDLERRNYVLEFVKYHLELPWYYADPGENIVDVISDHHSGPFKSFHKGCVQVIRPETVELYTKRYGEYDVIVHWRKWFEEHYNPSAVNVINSQDHSYGPEWLKTVEKATEDGKLHGILCFPKWHEENLVRELSRLSRAPQLLSGVTLGVDTGIYHPSQPKDTHALLWASDPGRGIGGAVELAIRLFQRDNRFRLHVCWPDYYRDWVSKILPAHPALVVHRNLDNGPELWGLFNTCGFLPYTSTFMEPSSRAHRQAMAAGCVVLYPPDMGTPSDLITSGVDGVVAPVDDWVELILEYAEDPTAFALVSDNARSRALSENWEVQAVRFNELFEGY